MKLHHLKPSPGSTKGKKRVARGDAGRGGKTAGRGTKGTGARKNVPAGFEGGQTPIIRRQPKLGGFKNPNKIDYAVINLRVLDDNFEAGTEVTSDLLRSKGLVRKNRPVKVLGHGEITKALNVKVEAISHKAKDKLEAAGGSAA